LVYEVEDDKIPFHTQYVSFTIIIINVIVFIIQLFDPTGYMFIYEAAFIPSEFFAGDKMWTIITSMFMHGSVIHIAMNLWFFYVVADNCEKAMGHILFLITYMVSGICAALLHAVITLLDPNLMQIPTLGASGAIFGVIGVYGILFPQNKLRILGVMRGTVSARTFILFYFIIEILYGFAAIMYGGDGVAHFAHVGGFIGGAIFAFLFKLIKQNNY
jgi:membrane associated rhomboid family serine protease